MVRKKVKVGLIQVDGKIPNLALMKISAFHKQQGDDVTIIDISTHRFDRIYGSKIFMGGSGYELKVKLPPDIEEMVPDYEQFNLDYSIGFTSRGCIRDCDFCIVKEKEGPIHEINMDWIKHTKVLLIDNNFLASPKWKEKLEYFIENKMKVSFNQGLDIRLITKESAALLAKVKYYNFGFTYRALYFAFDSIRLESVIRKKIPLLLEAGIPNKHLVFYMLIGHNSTFEEDMRRYKILWEEFGVWPFVMIYNRKPGKELHRFARWINKRVHTKYSWESWCQYLDSKK